MPNGIGYNECKVCHKKNVRFGYWEGGGGDHGPYMDNYSEKWLQAFICQGCRRDFEEALKKEGQEICDKCWWRVDYHNFETTAWSKTIGEECSTCQQRAEQEQQAEEERQEWQAKQDRRNKARQEIQDEINKKKAQIKKNEERVNNIPDNSSSNSSRSESTSSSYSPPPITNSTSTSVNCSECQKIISIGEKVYTWPHEPNEKYCESCGIQKTLVYETLKKMLEGYDCTVTIETNNFLSSRYKTFLRLAQRIAKGEKINIDNSPVSEEDKQGLRLFAQEKNQINQEERDKLNQTLFWASLFWIAVIGLVIYLVVRWRRKKREKELLFK